MTSPERHHLPDTRASVTRRIAHTGDLDIYVTVGFFEESAKSLTDQPIEQPGEVFIKLGKEGSTLAGFADAIAILMSLLLQFGIPWDRVARKLRNTNFDPRNVEGKSITHVIVTAVDEILSQRGSTPDQGYSP